MPGRVEPSDPSCPICSKPVTSGSLVLFQHGELLHVPCVSRAHQLRALDAAERSGAIRAKIAATVARTAKLADRFRQLGGVGLCAACRRPLWERTDSGTGGFIRRRDGKPIHIECPNP